MKQLNRLSYELVPNKVKTIYQKDNVLYIGGNYDNTAEITYKNNLYIVSMDNLFDDSTNYITFKNEKSVVDFIENNL